MCTTLRLRSPEPEVLNGLSVLKDGVSRVPSLIKPIREMEKNYAKAIRRHSLSATFPEKGKRVHGCTSKRPTPDGLTLFIVGDLRVVLPLALTRHLRIIRTFA